MSLYQARHTHLERSFAAINRSKFNSFFVDKIKKIRAFTADISPPSFSDRPLAFVCMNSTQLRLTMSTQSSTDCRTNLAVDPIPVLILKSVSDLVAPFIAELFNRSLAAGHFPQDY
jgi:hypothetical protein